MLKIRKNSSANLNKDVPLVRGGGQQVHQPKVLTWKKPKAPGHHLGIFSGG